MILAALLLVAGALEPADALAAPLPGGRGVIVDDRLLQGLPIARANMREQGKTRHCAGPALATVLVRLKEPSGEAITGPALRRAVVAIGQDGHRVAFTLAELDPVLGNKAAIIATRCDGQPLGPDAGPYRLVVPGEARAVRSVRQLVALELSQLP